MRSDKDGFIQGDPIADMRRSGEGRSEALLYGISGDVQAIRRALTGAATPSSRRSPRGDTASVLAPAAVPTSARKGERAQAATSASQSGTARLAVLADAVSAKPSQRNKKGQFSEKSAGSAEGQAGSGGPGSAGSESMFKGLGDRIAGAINNSGSMDEADPAVKAFGEVAQPLARGYQALAGGDKAERQKTGWFRKIFGELRMFRAEETGFSKAAGKSLKALEEKPEAGTGGSGGLFPGIGPLAGMVGGLGKGLLGAGKGLLRRVPMLGALFGGIGAASDIYGSETDGSLDRNQKDKNAGRAVGGLAGSVSGMLAGAKIGAMAGAIGGPIGVAIGGVLGGAVGMFFGDQAGQIIGDTVGGWVSSLREADIPGKIISAWSSTTDFLKSGFNSAIESWKNGVEFVSKKANSANEFVKEKTGVDVKAAASFAKNKLSEVGAKAAESTKNGLAYLGDNTTIGKGITTVGRAVFGNRNKDAMVKQMAESGITDPKEQAMFMAQLDHESGGFSKNEESFKYKSADRLMQVSESARKKGQPAVEQAMAQGPEAVAELMYGGRMGNKSPGDAYNFRGRGAIQLTGRANYARAGKALGLDLENHPELAAAPENSAKVAAWYWKDAELGAAARRGDVRAVTKGINGGANGLDDRTEKYGKYLSAASAGAFGASAPVVASMPNAPTVRPPSVPTVADASPIVVPLSSGGGKPPVVVSQAPADVGQDVRDRRIAHIATGGVSNG